MNKPYFGRRRRNTIEIPSIQLNVFLQILSQEMINI